MYMHSRVYYVLVIVPSSALALLLTSLSAASSKPSEAVGSRDLCALIPTWTAEGKQKTVCPCRKRVESLADNR